MLTLNIDNHEVENIFVKGFNGNKEKFLEFIQNSYQKKETLEAFQEDKERFLATYNAMQKGTMNMVSDNEANQEIDTFLNTL
jgi:hypothetical protein